MTNKVLAGTNYLVDDSTGLIKGVKQPDGREDLFRYTTDTGALFWVDATVTAALLDGGGSVTVVAAPTPTAQYKVRNIRLVGGGTNFAAGGDRNISLTDGTTTYTTIANADIESAPSATLDWGNAKVPFLTSKSDTATVAGATLKFAYSGGTTDHSLTGSIKFSVCLERVTY